MTSPINYHLHIDNPHQHKAIVKIKANLNDSGQVEVYLPSWSPGSYLMREYGRLVRQIKALDSNGGYLAIEQTDKGTWHVHGGEENANSSIEIKYEIYCHELTVRNSYIDRDMAFIHGPAVFMAIAGRENSPVELKVTFPEAWSKISTGLKDISSKREEFLYSAENYDVFIDAPLQIGCHETDGFVSNGKEHELAFVGQALPHQHQVKKDMKIIVDHISEYMDSMPYDRYVFITHLFPGKFGGLEHLNSTALQFCSTSFPNRKDYVNWLSLVSHEYFHTWNVKRIRPKSLGPFNYRKEADASMLWLAEGLTSFMDELFVYQCGVVSLEEYLELQVKNFNRYYDTLGRKFHSLHESAFNAWNVLYKPHENGINSTISYYLKGGISFFLLNVLLVKSGSSTKEFIHGLWERYLANPEEGMEAEEVYQLIEKISSAQVREKFEEYIETTVELPIRELLKEMGLDLEYTTPTDIDLGVKTKVNGGRVFVTHTLIDSPAYNYGLNPEDEILAVDGKRVDSANFDQLKSSLKESNSYEFLISRLGEIKKINIIPRKALPKISSIKVLDQALVDKFLK